jgi:hypothetical protein
MHGSESADSARLRLRAYAGMAPLRAASARRFAGGSAARLGRTRKERLPRIQRLSTRPLRGRDRQDGPIRSGPCVPCARARAPPAAICEFPCSTVEGPGPSSGPQACIPSWQPALRWFARPGLHHALGWHATRPRNVPAVEISRVYCTLSLRSAPCSCPADPLRNGSIGAHPRDRCRLLLSYSSSCVGVGCRLMGGQGMMPYNQNGFVSCGHLFV